MSTRDLLITHIQTALAATPGLEEVQVVKSARATDTLNKPTLVIRTDGYTKLPAAPLTKRQGTFLAALVSPLTDLDDAEDELDDLLELLLPTLLTSGISWQTANLTGYGDRYLAYDITIISILS